MAIQGLRTTMNFATDQRPKNWREGILLLYPNGKAPLTALTAQMKKAPTDDPEFHWWTKMLSSRRIAVTTGINTSATTIAASGGGCNQFKAGDLLLVEQTGEVLRVASITSDTAMEVVRAFAGSTAAALTITTTGVNPNLVCIGSAYEENSSAPTGVNFDPVKLTNYTQIFRNTLEASRTAQKTRLRTGDQVKEAKRECLELHSIDMERAFFFGRASESTLSGKPIRTTGGVLAMIDSGNIVTADTSTGVDFATLEGYMERMFRYGSNEKMAFVGSTAALTIQRIVRYAKGVNWTFNSDKEFGMDVQRLTCPFGSLVLKTHPLFNQMTGGSGGSTPGAYYGMSSAMVVLDMAELRYRPLTDADTKYQPNLQDNGVDGMQSGYLTEAGLEWGSGLNHFLVKNLAVAKLEADNTATVVDAVNTASAAIVAAVGT